MCDVLKEVVMFAAKEQKSEHNVSACEQEDCKSESSFHIVLAGGGTAGHVNPLLAVADAIKKFDSNAQISVIGTKVGLEVSLVPQAGYELDTIEKVPFPRKPNLAAFKFPIRWIQEKLKVSSILKQRKADVVVGFGGYASAPVYSQAHAQHLPIVVHEQNAKAGMANKLGARWATMVGSVYNNTGLRTKAGVSVERIGLPLRPAIARLCRSLSEDSDAARVEGAKQLGLDPNRPIVLITGGSLGAASVNQAVASAAKDLLSCAQVVHLTGKGKDEKVREIVSQNVGVSQINDIQANHLGLGDYHIAQYLERIDWAFACADLVICRAGAGTVSEISALGLPAVYVPLPIGNGEQRFNAEPVVSAGGALMVNDSEFNENYIRKTVVTLLKDTKTLNVMKEASWRYGIRNAADVMAQRILKIAKERKPSKESRK